MRQARRPTRPLLEILHAVQNELGCVPPEAVPLIAEALNLSRAEVHGVVSFYHHFREQPAGPAHVQALPRRSLPGDEWRRARGIREAAPGCDFGETRADGTVTLEAVYCLGNCACAPSAMIDGQLAGRVDATALEELRDEWGVPA